jgi:hypothetical protein
MKTCIPALLVVLLFFSSGCRKKNDASCAANNFSSSIPSRNFSMGFTTWPFGPDIANRTSTYQFIGMNADIYSEQFDNYIPWNALMNDLPLPADLTNDIASRLSLRPSGHEMMVSVSLLNIERTNLLVDQDGSLPPYTTLNDPAIATAYIKYLKYLVSQFQPDYLVLAMEVNVFRMKQESKWTAYKSLVQTVKAALKADYPTLQMAESVTLHDWFNPAVPDAAAYISEIDSYVNQQDFAAISFYPFLKGQDTKSEFQQAFDFLHAHTTRPIAFTETGHIAENLSVPAFNLSITGNVCEQRDYLETLLSNAHLHQYHFLIWWTHRDYDELWKIFPDSTKDLGKLWKDTGLLNENGGSRPAFSTWKSILLK